MQKKHPLTQRKRQLARRRAISAAYRPDRCLPRRQSPQSLRKAKTPPGTDARESRGAQVHSLGAYLYASAAPAGGGGGGRIDIRRDSRARRS